MKVKTVKAKGDGQLRRTMEQMLKEGWELQDHADRRARYSATAGVLTRKRVHTLTFVKREDGDE